MSELKVIVCVLLLLAFEGGRLIECSVARFTKIECEVFDKSFVEFKECKLKMVGRNKAAMRIHVHMLQLPVTNASIHAQLFRKSNDFRPFLYNNTIDVCAFLKNVNIHLFWKVIYNFIKPYTNINHSCPYNHDLILQDLVLDEDMYKNLPLPSGEYKIRFNVAAYNQFRAAVSAFLTLYNRNLF